MSCEHDMANGTCSQCDPFVVQNIRASRDLAVRVLGKALWQAGSVRMAHGPSCPIAPGTKCTDGKVVGMSDNEADCNCWVSEARRVVAAADDRGRVMFVPDALVSSRKKGTP